MKNLNKKNIYTVLLSLGILFLAFFDVYNIFAETSIEYNPKITIYGAMSENQIELSKRDLKAMPIMSKVDNIITFASTENEKKYRIEGVNLSYLLKDFSGIEVKEADVLLIDSKNKNVILKKFSELTEDSNDYVLVYKVNEEDGSLAEEYTAEGFILINKDGLVSRKNTELFFVDKIKINSALSVKKMPKHAPEYTDIGEEYKYAANAISELSKLDIVSGISETEFAPQNYITRAYLSKMLVDALELDLVNYDNSYSDVAYSDWYAPYIATAVSQGLLNGYTDGTFGPEDQINRQEFATVCAELAIKTGRIRESELIKFNLKDSRFKDSESVFGWVENSVAYLDSLGVYYPYIKDEFLPLMSVNRAEASYILYILLFDN